MRESLAPLVCNIMRLADGAASGAWRLSFPFDQNGLAPPEVYVGWRQVADALVISQVIVVGTEGHDLGFEIARRLRALIVQVALDLGARRPANGIGFRCGRSFPVSGACYGETNRELQAALESEGAEVIEIVTYRWALPEDTAPLLRLIGALGRDEIDLVAFTGASQASNLFTVAQCDGKEASLKQSLGRTLVASIGPVCSAALRKLAVRVDIEAKPPKLGPFIEAINAALSDRRPLGKS
jgi:Uroporphyrinogen-III synthase HemD